LLIVLVEIANDVEVSTLLRRTIAEITRRLHFSPQRALMGFFIVLQDDMLGIPTSIHDPSLQVYIAIHALVDGLQVDIVVVLLLFLGAPLMVVQSGSGQMGGRHEIVHEGVFSFGEALAVKAVLGERSEFIVAEVVLG